LFSLAFASSSSCMRASSVVVAVVVPLREEADGA
jgi:hypothetical protein